MRVVRLLVVVAVAAKLAIVLAVLHALLKVPSVSVLIVVVAVSILVAIMFLGLILAPALVLLCGNRGNKPGRAEPGEGDSKCQHPY